MIAGGEVGVYTPFFMGPSPSSRSTRPWLPKLLQVPPVRASIVGSVASPLAMSSRWGQSAVPAGASKYESPRQIVDPAQSRTWAAYFQRTAPVSASSATTSFSGRQTYTRSPTFKGVTSKVVGLPRGHATWKLQASFSCDTLEGAMPVSGE